jgi:hypothetical protein
MFLQVLGWSFLVVFASLSSLATLTLVRLILAFGGQRSDKVLTTVIAIISITLWIVVYANCPIEVFLKGS